MKITLALALAFCTFATAEVHNVPADFTTIQAALDAAEPGDSVAIAPGTYSESILIGDGRTLVGSASADCVIEGDGTGRIVTISGSVRMEGLTIRNGETGIYLLADASLDISGCLIADNKEDGIGFDNAFNTVLQMNDCVITRNGDGVDLESTQAVIRHCRFERNRDDGLDLDGDAGALIYNCDFVDNPDDGMEIRLATRTHAIIQHCRFTGNGEDGIEVIDSPLDDGLYNIVCIQNNVFRDNARHAVGFVDQKTEEAGEAMVKSSVYACRNAFEGGAVSANYAEIFDALPSLNDDLGSARVSLVQGDQTWSVELPLRMPTLVGVYNLHPTADGMLASDLEGVTVSGELVYVADDNLRLVYQVDRKTGNIAGSIPTNPFAGSSESALGPEGLDLDSQNSLLLADDDGRAIYRLSLAEENSGQPQKRWSTESIGAVEGLERVGERLLLAVNRNELHQVDAETLDRLAEPMQFTIDGFGNHVAGVGLDDATGRVFVTASGYTGSSQKWRNNQSAFLALNPELNAVTVIWHLGPFSNDPRGIAVADGLIYVVDGRSDYIDERTGEYYRGGIKVFVFVEDGVPAAIDQILPLLPVRHTN
jgi:DNA-binding beta-propeller fold protein YncE